jgi:hypothetical protein
VLCNTLNKVNKSGIPLNVFIYFIYRLFNYAFSSSDYIALNDGMISEELIGKDVEGNEHGLICLKGVKKTMETCSQNSCSPTDI